MTVAPSSPPVMSSILGPTRQSAEGLMTDAAPFLGKPWAPVPYQAGPPGEPHGRNAADRNFSAPVFFGS